MQNQSLKGLQRQNLAHLPTPIQFLDKLSQDLGANVYVKRDDFSGLELSGNKIRKLEFSLAEALAQGCDTVITTGAIQSNHCRATAFACQKLGLSCTLVLTAQKPEHYEGNTFLDLMAGADLRYIGDGSQRDEYIETLMADLKKAGNKPYYIPVGASNAVGSLGYMNCYEEILEQEKDLNLSFDAICLAVGSGGTYAGLWYANALNEGSKDIVGICVCDDAVTFTAEVDQIVRDLNKGLDRNVLPKHLSAEECIDANNSPEMQLIKAPGYIFNDQYIGEGYAKTTEAEIKFLIDMAGKTGIVFDPCYTGKAFRGLVSEINKGGFKDHKNILFIHTGGLFGWTRESMDIAERLF